MKRAYFWLMALLLGLVSPAAGQSVDKTDWIVASSFPVDSDQPVYLSENERTRSFWEIEYGSGAGSSYEQSGVATLSNWVPMQSPETPRVEAQTAVINGKLFVFAGFAVQGAIKITDKTEMFDPATNRWETRAPMPVAVTHMGCVAVGTKVWIIGGFVGDHPGPATDIVQIYDTETDTWSNGPRLPAKRASLGAVKLGNTIHIFGGLMPDRNTDTSEHYVLNLNNPSAGWRKSAPLPVPRNHLGSAVVGGRIYAIGGQKGHDGGAAQQSYIHEYNPKNNTWTQKAGMPIPRSHFEPGTFTYNGSIYIAGGVGNGTENKPSMNQIHMYDPSTNKWTLYDRMPEKLLAPIAKRVGDRLIVSHGGIQGSADPQNTIWYCPFGNTNDDRMGFFPAELDMGTVVSETLSVNLWSFNSEIPVRISTIPENGWLHVTRPAVDRVDPNGLDLEIFVNGRGLAAGMYEGAVVVAADGLGEFRLPVRFTSDGSTVDVEEDPGSLPGDYVLEPAYPNPFNPSATIRFALAESQPAELVLVDLLGRELTVLYQGTPHPGEFQNVSIDGSGLPSGFYFVVLRTYQFTTSQTVQLSK